MIRYNARPPARMAKSVDAADLKSASVRSTGSSPVSGTT